MLEVTGLTRAIVSVVLAAALTGCGGSSDGGSGRTPDGATGRSTTGMATTTATATTRTPPTGTWTIDQARRALAPAGSTVLVLGDSTGDDLPFEEWVSRWSTEAGLNVATWDRRSQAGYGQPATRTAPVRLWNASMSGSRADYPVAHWQAIWPHRPPDLVLLNYGHNYTTVPDLIEPEFEALRVKVAGAAPRAPIVVVLQQPQRGDANAANRERIAAWAHDHGLPTIDVAQAFRESGQPEDALLADDIHPNRQGSQLWADTVAAELD